MLFAALGASAFVGLGVLVLFIPGRAAIGGRLAAQAVKASGPTGNTYMVAPNATFVFQHLTYPVSVLRYDMTTDFSSVAQVTSYPMAMVVNGNWAAPTRLRSSGAPGTSDLRFGSVFRLDIRLFSDLGRQKALTDLSPFFKGSRLAFQFDNILDSRQKVTDASGSVPLSYQADYLDPRGRMIGIDFRKMF